MRLARAVDIRGPAIQIRAARPSARPTNADPMLTAPLRVVRGNLASVVLPLALLGIGAPRLRAQTTTQSATADTSQCNLIDADRPGLADGSHVIGAGQIQLETAYQQERHRDDDVPSRLSFAPTLLRVGLTSRVEARIESSTYARQRFSPPDGSATTSSGFTPIFFGAKIVLYDPNQSGPLQVATIVRVAPPSGSDDFKSDRTAGDVRLVADWQFAPTLSLNPNVGYGGYQGSDGTLVNTALAALTLTWQPTPRWNPFVDAAYASREDAGRGWAMIADAGVAYILGCNLKLDVTVGQGLHGVTQPKPFVAAGVSVRADLFHRSTHPLDHLHGDRPAQPARI